MSNGRGTYSHRSHRRHARQRATLWLALVAGLSGNAAAFDLEYEVGLATKRSDNINLSEGNPVSDWVLSPQFRFEAAQDGPRIQLAATGDAQYLHYTSNTFDDELRGTFAGKLNWTVLPDRIDVVVQDYLSRQPVDVLAPLTPNNEQQANVFIVGPSFHARLGATTRGQLDLRYANSHAEETRAFNGDRFDVAARVLRKLDANQSISANLQATKVELDLLGASSDYNAYDGYIGYRINRKAFDANIDLGYSRLNPRIGSANDATSSLVRATLDWRVSPRGVLTATVRHQLTDATQALITHSLEVDRQAFSDFRYLDVLVRPNPYREQLVRLRYQHTRDRLTVRLTPYFRRIRYLDELIENESRRGMVLDLEYRLRPRLDLSVLAVSEERKYSDLAREDEDLAISMGLVNRFTRHWTGRIDIQRRERDSNAIGRSFDANAVILSLSYRR